VYFAVALGVVAAGLLIGTLFGRGRKLIWLGVPLVAATIIASSVGDFFDGGTGDRNYEPTTVADIVPRYEVGLGSITLDLSQVDFVDHVVQTDIRAGAGDLTILVPRNVDVTIRAHAAAGSLHLFGTDYGGPRETRRLTDNGPDGLGGGSLTLILNIGIGDMEVDRA
jgi:predicted membrane protein